MILVHGSGPNDRDETLGPNTPFRDLAHGLATRGIAVLRYDKRTFAQKEKLLKQGLDKTITIKEEVLDDVMATLDKAQTSSRESMRIGSSCWATAAAEAWPR